CLCLRALFFFSSRRRHTRFSRDWSSDVCSSDLLREWVAEQTLEMVRVDQSEGLLGRDEKIIAMAKDAAALAQDLEDRADAAGQEIGRASCREGVQMCVVGQGIEEDIRSQ